MFTANFIMNNNLANSSIFIAKLKYLLNKILEEQNPSVYVTPCRPAGVDRALQINSQLAC